MADRIFPNTFKEEPLDSDLVFKGIDWDNFNTKLAQVKDSEQGELTEEFREILAGKMPDKVREMFEAKNKRSPDADDLSDVPEQLRDSVEKSQEKAKKKKNKKVEKAEKCDCGKEPCECDKKESGWDKGSMKKKAFHFTHPSQLSAEAIEAAQSAGNEDLVKAIVAARHERRVRLASKIEEKFEEEAEHNQKLAQRKAYREALVSRVAQANKSEKTASNDDFVKVSSMNNNAKKAFAAKAIAQGFPQEYVDAMLGADTKPVADNTKEIRTIMSSDLNLNVKKSAVTSMVKEAKLSDADYSRLVDYWKNELGYGDQEWIDALFTKKYDK